MKNKKKSKINNSKDNANLDQMLSKLKNHPVVLPIVLVAIILIAVGTFFSSYETIKERLSNLTHRIDILLHEPKVKIFFADSDNNKLNVLLSEPNSEAIDIGIAVENYSKKNAYNVKLELFHSIDLKVGQRQGTVVVSYLSPCLGDNGRERNYQKIHLGDLPSRSSSEKKFIPVSLVISPPKLGLLHSRNYELDVYLIADNITKQIHKLHLTFAQRTLDFSSKKYFVPYKDGKVVRLRRINDGGTE